MIHPAPPVRLRRRVLLAALLTAWLTAFAATHVPAPRVPHGLPSDKTLHLLTYAVLAGLMWLTLRAYGRPMRSRALATFAALALYGAFDEITQPLVNRSAEVRDWLFDTLGVVLALAIGALVEVLGARSAPAAAATGAADGASGEK